MITLTCAHCSVEYTTTKGSHRVALWRGQTKFYCSPKCVGLAQRVVLSMACDECGKTFTRRPSENKVSKSGLRFCSRACGSANRGRQRKLANAANPKPPKVPVTCRTCGSTRSLTANGRWRCPRCSRIVGPLGPRTKGELFASRKNWQSARSSIQTTARRAFLRANPHPTCDALVRGSPCGYAKHVEVAHRRDVSSFPDSALISEINDLTNLVGLCPLHHWEFDHQKLDEPLP